MSHKNVTIASILKIWLGFDSKSLKLDQDMKSNHSEFLYVTLSKRLNSQPRFENCQKLVKNRVLDLAHVYIIIQHCKKCVSLVFFVFLFLC